jgi:hypothetical protein
LISSVVKGSKGWAKFTEENPTTGLNVATLITPPDTRNRPQTKALSSSRYC